MEAVREKGLSGVTEFIKLIKGYKKAGILSYHQYSTFKGQAVKGDMAGAIKGLNKLLRKGA